MFHITACSAGCFFVESGDQADQKDVYGMVLTEPGSERQKDKRKREKLQEETICPEKRKKTERK